MGTFRLTPFNRGEKRSFGSSATDNFNKNVEAKKAKVAIDKSVRRKKEQMAKKMINK